ncbi:MAG: hypothetical protein ACM3NH_04035 [Candidatus Saccharibacteria bacterium]
MGRKKERKIGNFDYRLAQLVGILDVFIRILTDHLPVQDRLKINGFTTRIEENGPGANTTVIPAGWKDDCIAVHVIDFKDFKWEWASIFSDRLLPLIGSRAIVMHPGRDGVGFGIELPQARLAEDPLTHHYVLKDPKEFTHFRRAVAETNRRLRSIQFR